MTWLLYVLYALVALVVAVFVAGQAGFLAGKEPPDLGIKDGKLKPPSRTENSVSSQAGLYPDHPMKAYAEIAPFKFTGDGRAAINRIKRIVETTEGARIVRAEPTYLYAQFQTRWLKFVDDVEFFADDEAKLVHVRSASRIGRGDLGVNRTRIEAIRARFAAQP
ncbi:MAG TPA: DUF1499 domain-containing protein [Bradyrhizobium sp.]|nr:DUF1499 domain-containing protein [Bradyrhizobium sp.]